MKSTPTFFRRQPSYRGSCRGFSFTEILFAVMILGIGFIMVAAMFPVAIHQTEDSNRETIAASIGRAGYSCLSQLAGQVVTWSGTTPALTSSVLLPTVPNPTLSLTTPVTIPKNQSSLVIPGQVWTFNDTQDSYGSVVYGTAPTALTELHPALLYTLISKNLIQATDQRFAWAAFYKRDLIAQGPATTLQTPVPASFAQIILVGVQCRVKPAYDPVIDTQLPSTLFPQLVTQVNVTAGNATGTGNITFGGAAPAVAENAYVIVSSDGGSGIYNGRVYRLGPAVSGSTTNYFVVPGEGPAASDAVIKGATVYVVGRAPDPGNPTSAAGASQDISVYSTFVQTP
jgi:type II secretory pathway pseudopilin PulG